MTHAIRTTTMKAIAHDAYGSTDALELREMDKPAIGDGEVLVRVRAAGVDPSVWHLVSGLPYLVRVMGFGLRRPKMPVPGQDIAGVVEAVGAAVTRFGPGDEVFGAAVGAFAEYARASEGGLAPLPASLSFAQAAAIPTSGTTALQALRDKGRVESGQRVLVIGAAGGVGTFAVQMAKAWGAEVTGVCSTSKTDLVTSIGADDVIDYTREDPFAGARTYDLVLDCAGNRSLRTLRRALTPTGTLVIIGGEGGGRWLGGTERLLRAAVLSLVVRQRLLGLFANHREEDLREITDLVEAGKVRPVLDQTFPLGAAPEAISYVQHGRARGKVVLTV